MTDRLSPWLVIAHLVRPQGRKGELLAELLTEFPERFGGLPRVYVAAPGFVGAPEAARTATVTSFWLPTGKQAGRVVLGLDISASITEAEQLAGNDVLIPRIERRSLADDAVYVHDLVGCVLLDGASVVGTVRDVLSLAGPTSDLNAAEAAPVLVVTGEDGFEYLVPFARAYLRSIDLQQRRLEMDLPEGLLDIYRPGGSADQKR